MSVPPQRTTNRLVEEAMTVLTALGYDVRLDHLGGRGSGFCQLGNRRWMLIDVAQPADEQLDKLCEAIKSQSLPDGITLSDELQAYLMQAPTID